MQSDCARTYAFTNQFEFLAVIAESFLESPQQLKLKFPEGYLKK
ncbi:zinc-dependent peptidase [Yeosuana sp.]